MAVFERACPQFMAIGMTYEQFWDGDVSAHRAFRKAHKLRLQEQNQMAWLQGMYIYEAIGNLSPALKAFAKGRPKPYPKEPYDLYEEQRRAREEAEQKKRYERMKEKVAAFAKAFNEQRNSERNEVDANG